MNLKSFGTAVKDIDSCSVTQPVKSQGKFTGTLFTIKPALNYTMLGGEAPKAFDCADITLLINTKRDDKYVTEEVPAFAMNLKHTDSTDKRIRYSTVLFRGCTLESLTKEFIENHKNGTDLLRGKALYSMIEDNGLTLSEFDKHLSGGKEFRFAQYKRGNKLNYVDWKYYDEKIDVLSNDI
tara:strand:- start:11458 stop:12000 length:543 start_codon:yes stop_codon:yes gene_type:complete